MREAIGSLNSSAYNGRSGMHLQSQAEEWVQLQYICQYDNGFFPSKSNGIVSLSDKIRMYVCIYAWAYSIKMFQSLLFNKY